MDVLTLNLFALIAVCQHIRESKSSPTVERGALGTAYQLERRLLAELTRRQSLGDATRSQRVITKDAS